MFSHSFSPSYQASKSSSVRCYIGNCLYLGMQPWPLTRHNLIPWMARGWMLGNRASSINTGAMNVRGYCKSALIDCLTSMHDRNKVKDFTRGLLSLEDRPVSRPRPVTASELIKIAAVIDIRNPSDMQQMTIVTVCYGALLRGGTPCGDTLQVHHVVAEGGGVLRLDLHKIKTHRLIAGAVPCWLCPSTTTQRNAVPNGRLLDPALMLGTYLATTSLRDYPSAPLFPKLGPGGTPVLPLKPISYGSWLKGFKALCTRAGIQPRSLQALRAGGRTDLANQGLSEAMINKAGRWAPGSTASTLYNRPGIRLALMVKGAHQRELELAAASPRN